LTIHISDAQLVYRTLNSDKQAYEALVNKYYTRINKFCIAKVSNPYDAEDLTQEVFVQAYANLHKLHEPEKFCPWLLSISANLIKKYLRYKYKNEASISLENFNEWSLYEESTDELSQMTEEQVLNKLDFSPFYELIQSLPEQYSKSFTMRYLNDMTYKDIAQLLKLPLSTVKARMYNARQWILRKSLSPKAPRELRAQISELVTNVAQNYEELNKKLYANILENQLVLSLLDPIRLHRIPIKVFTYTLGNSDISDNIMIVANFRPDIPSIIIKSKEQIVVRAFLQLLPKNKPLRIIVLEENLWDVIDEFASTSNKKNFLTYYLPPHRIRKTKIHEGITEIQMSNNLVLQELSSLDNNLSQIIQALKNENPEYLHNMRLFIHKDSSKTIDAYALFCHSGIANLWELATCKSFLDDNEKHLSSCISMGSDLLLKQGFHITINSIPSQDTTSQNILEDIGFQHILTCVGATILIK
jgi:RNA polymerase sigma-70 factor (ECF subfamily)